MQCSDESAGSERARPAQCEGDPAILPAPAFHMKAAMRGHWDTDVIGLGRPFWESHFFCVRLRAHRLALSLSFPESKRLPGIKRGSGLEAVALLLDTGEKMPRTKRV